MSCSLLYPEGIAPAAPMDRRILYHLSLDRAFSYISSDEKLTRRFFDVLLQPCGRETVLYRQAILRDLQADPQIFAQLSSFAKVLRDISGDFHRASQEVSMLRAGGAASLFSAQNLLQMQAKHLGDILRLLRSLDADLNSRRLRAEGLLALHRHIQAITDSSAASALLPLCSRLELFESADLKCRYRLDKTGRIVAFEVVELEEEAALQKRPHRIHRKVALPEGIPLQMTAADAPKFDSMKASALKEITQNLSVACRDLLDRFAHLGDELAFYAVALKYIRALAQKGSACSYPTFGDGAHLEFTDLRDLYLLMTVSGAEHIVPSSLQLNDNRGVLLYGDNGSGKTVFLRSVSTMQLLGQAGLPVPAERAQLSCVAALATQFSESEKGFLEATAAGRFEQEVRELAAMVDSLPAGSLVLLNETFQSTAYTEGAEGLSHLLHWFSDHGIRWILVTHLLQLDEYLKDLPVVRLHTSEGYRIS